MKWDTETDKRHCVRCGAETLGGANRPEHLCADIAKRLARREKQVQAVLDLLSQHGFEPDGCKACGMDEGSSTHGEAEACGCDYPDDHHEFESAGRAVAEAIVQRLSNLGVTED